MPSVRVPALRRPLFALLLGLTPACAPDDEIASQTPQTDDVPFRLGGLPDQTQLVRLRLALNGAPDRNIEQLTAPDLTRFTLALPKGAQGTLTMEAEAFRDPLFVVARGQASTALPTVSEQTLTLQALLPLQSATVMPTHTLEGIWATANDDVWIGGFGVAIHWDGSKYTQVGLGPERYMHDIFGFAPDGPAGAKDLWIGGDNGLLVHGDGLKWKVVDSTMSLSVRGLWGMAQNDLWIVGGGVAHYDGTLVTKDPASAFTSGLHAVWGTRKDDVWAVGDGGEIFHYDGSAWTPRDSPTRQNLRSVWASSPTDVWAVGKGGTVLRYNGTSWMAVPLPGNYQGDLNRVRGTGPDNVWMCDDRGNLLKWNGRYFSARPGGAGIGLVGLHVGTGDELWAVGDHGIVVHAVNP